MKGKLPKRLLSLLLSGMLIVTGLDMSTVYAAEETIQQESPTDSTNHENETSSITSEPEEEYSAAETSAQQVQDGSPERPAEQKPSEAEQKTETEKALESEEASESEKAPETEKTSESENASETEKASESENASETEKASESENASESEKATETENASETEETASTETTEDATAEQETATEEETLSDEETTEEAETLNPDAEENTDVPTPKEVYDKMIAMQSEYPEGMHWTDASSGNYKWNGGRGENGEIANVGSGCVYFAYRLSDEAFGSLPARMLRPGNFTFDDIMVGDILRVENNRHSVIVLQVNDDTIVIAEGNYNSSIHWGRIMTKSEVEAADHVLTRYPKGYMPPDDPEADKTAAEGTVGNGLTWKLTNSGTLTISGNGAMPDFTFGGTSDAPVSDRPWNDHIGKVQKIVIENGVTGIGSNAFRGSVAYSVSIPASVKTIGNDTFRECKNITFATPEGVVTIGERAFRGCANLKGITIPGSIETVGAGAFYDCTELRNAKFVSGGKTVTMGDNVFTRCWYLSDVTLPVGLETISKYMFQNCLVLRELSIPAGVTVIDEGAFSGCSVLTTLYIPKSVTDINMQVFTQCGLTDIYYDGSESEWNAIGKWGDSKTILSTLQSNGKVHYGTSAPAEPYTVTFDTQGHGTAPTPIEAVAGETIAKPDAPSADGYKFEGWYKEADCINAWNFDADTVESDMTLYAKWTDNTQNPDDPKPSETYTITYELNDGINHADNPANYTAETETIVLKAPTREGYTFDGWYRDAALTLRIVQIEKGSSGNLTLYAKWTKTDTPDDPNKPENPDDPNKPENPDDTNKPENPDDPDTPPIQEFTVTFDTNGHGSAPQPYTGIKSGERIKKPADPTAQDYHFDGWYKESACRTAWDFDTDTVTEDLTLYAKWIDKDDDYYYPEPQRKDLKSSGAVIADIKAAVYNAGKPYCPTVKVTIPDGSKRITLTEGTDYRILYKNNDKAGTATAIVRGNGIYTGEIQKTYTINKKLFKKVSVITGGMQAGAEGALPIHVYDGTKLLKENVDYTLSQPTPNSKNTSASVQISAKKDSCYDGAVTAKITLYTADADKIINPEHITLNQDKAPYTGKAVTSIIPTVTINGTELVKNKHYKVQYKNNTKAGDNPTDQTALVIVTGKGQYKGKVIVPFTITASSAAFSIKDIPDKTYNGKPQKPALTVKAGNKKLKANTDYTVEYTNNVHAGTATVIVKGIGNYKGKMEKTFTIKPQKISKASVKGTVSKDDITLTYNKKSLVEKTDYTIEKIGETKTKTKVKFIGKGDFTGEVIKSIKK